MALPMVHLGAAQAALKELNIQNPASYYLGSIAPDGVHMLEGCTPEDKDRSHLGTRSSHDPKAVEDFLKHLPDFADRDYALGYAVHILTDLLWAGPLMAEFKRRYEEDPAPVLDKKKAYYNDTDQIDLQLYETLPGRKEIWRELERAKAIDLPGALPGEAADLWNRRTLVWYENLGEFEITVRYFSLSKVLDFLSEAAQYAVKICRKFL